MTDRYEETRGLIALAISQLRKANTRIKRTKVDHVSIRELLKNAQRVNRSAQRTFRKESK